jgi:glycine hydroxymethyltransferase
MAKREKPKLMLAGFSAYSRKINYQRFTQIAKKVGAISMMDMAHIAGLVAGKSLSNPVPYFDIVTTTTHKTLRGPRGGMILCKKKYAQVIDKAAFPGFQGGPHMNNIAAKAVAFGEALQPSFRKYTQQILKNAKVLEGELKKYGFKIVFGKTENHMLLVDVFGSKGLTGKKLEGALDSIGLTVNKNIIPDDPRSPFDPSGIRLGVPAVTTRGMKERDMKKIAGWINQVAENITNEKMLRSLRKEVRTFCRQFPLHKQ